MNILKRNIPQMILAGMIFSLISGTIAFFAFDAVKEQEIEKQFVIIDVASGKSWYKGITELRVNQQNEQLKPASINEELYSSINYTVIRYQRDPRLLGKCYNIQKTLIDNSIFIETPSYPSKDKSLMDKCMINLLDISFERLKSKLQLRTEQERLRIKIIVDDLLAETSKLEKKNKLQSINDHKEDSRRSIVQIMCKEMEPIYSYVLKGVNLFAQDQSLKEAIASENTSDEVTANSASISVLFQNIIALSAMAKECDQEYSIRLNYDLANEKLGDLVNFEKNLTKANKILETTKFEDVFLIEKISITDRQQRKFISKVNIILAFSLLGFLFGVILVYNFRISK